MKSNQFKISCKRGFTLIELLVVVLIIGILAAVAVPQYQKAVYKSRMTQALITGRAFMNAQHTYHLANGVYADNFDDLDVAFTIPSNWHYFLALDGHLYMSYNNEEVGWDFYPNTKLLYCYVKKAGPRANALYSMCQSFTGDTNPDEDNITGGRKKYKMNF